MGTTQTSAMLYPLQNLSSSGPALKVLESKIGRVEEEMYFYRSLLSWLLLSCHEEKRFAIETFRAELAHLHDAKLSALQDGMERLKNDAHNGIGQFDVLSDIAHFQLYFNHIDDTLQALKSKIHRNFSDFTHVCIW